MIIHFFKKKKLLLRLVLLFNCVNEIKCYLLIRWLHWASIMVNK